MGHVTYGDGIAIGQITYYVPALLASAFVIHKHGAKKSAGWFFLTLFCLVRIVGAAARLCTISNPNSNGAWTASLVCSALGLSPLFMATLGLLSRAYYSILDQPASTILRTAMVLTVHGPASVAVILCIVGATSAPSAAQIYNETSLHIGYILYTVVLVLLTVLTLGAWMAMRRKGRGEGLLVLAPLCALPFLWVRLIYSLLAIFSHIKTFSMASNSTSSETVSLVMSVLEEMAVVLIYLATGLKLSAMPEGPETSSAGKAGYTAGRSDFGPRRRGLFSLGAATSQTSRAVRTDPEANELEKYGPGLTRAERIPRSQSFRRYQ